MLGSRSRAQALVLASGSLLLASCFTTVGKWTSPSGRYPTTACERPAEAVIAVERLLDLRSQTNMSWIAWSYVPLSPGGWMHFDRPDATLEDSLTPRYDIDPSRELAESIVIELRRENLVQDAHSTREGFGPEHTHVLRGKLRSFFVHESRWTYFLSVYGEIFWLLGAPVGSSDNGFCVDLELADTRDGRIVWQGSIFDADSHVEGLYYGPEWYRFGWMWERRLREKLRELAMVLGTQPAPLPENLQEELAQSPPPVMPQCLGVDARNPCTVR